MRTIGSVKLQAWSIEDYLYSDIIRKSENPDVGEITFRYALPPLPEGVTIDVDAFCSEDGVSWTNMNVGKSYLSANTQNGIYDEISLDLQSLDDDFLKFGFNVNGDNFSTILFGAVTAE